jgi:hypothetical protein
VRAGTAGWIASAKGATTTFEIGSKSLIDRKADGSWEGR